MRKGSNNPWKVRQQRWWRFVKANLQAIESGKAIALGPSPRPLVHPGAKAAKSRPLSVVICSPHPDDESLVGALPLRLRQECGAHVTNCAITLGSDRNERPRRRRELERACAVLGFDLVIAQPPAGFDHVNLQNRQNQPEAWAAKWQVLSNTLEALHPDVVFVPHADDFNSTHIGTHHLVIDALGNWMERAGRSSLTLVETEFWQANAQPNLLVGISPEDLAILLMAAAEHGGEMRRNPYHLRQPGRLMANTTRGAEVIGGQGAAAPDFDFAELYRLARLSQRKLLPVEPGRKILAPGSRINWKRIVP